LEEQVFETTKSALGNLVGWLKARDCPIVGLDGQFTEHHALLIRLSLSLHDELEREIAALDEAILQASEPFATQVSLLSTIPGVRHKSAVQIIAEIGPDVSRFGSAKRLSSWAAVCPGNRESCGQGFDIHISERAPLLRDHDADESFGAREINRCQQGARPVTRMSKSATRRSLHARNN
jgi:transposase